MCLATYYQHKVCRHIWATITEPCGPGMGFFNCSSFCDGTTNATPRFYRTKSRPCPRCDLDGVYDRNTVRMVEAMGRGIKWGVGPDVEDWGIDCNLGSSRGRMCVIL
ncbi:hypothetical protein NLU13_2265 [Sarocladium strictum]|uniref:Uncharacterized protein n=1 Tax=Sarocladium strictum TaxID=5046 RepID=A0AA39GSH7_SARSR|nr:hypothetical protein NLU13_2265 [Sarocladium strictum]